MPLYLGFDCSTQAITAIVIEVDGATRRVVLETSLNFDAAFPRYGTTNGVLPQHDPRVATSSPRLWAEALDEMMATIARQLGPAKARIAAVSGAAQQHGSVYLTALAAARLAGFDPSLPLVQQLDGCFSREEAPIWMDASTDAECRAIEDATGGPRALAALTGSRAFERFTGPQIRRFAESDPAAYARTDRIHLVSSYLASLLTGRHAPTEPGDAAGMNLMDIRSRVWAPAALQATAPDLERRLPAIVASSHVIGALSPYWRERHGFPSAKAVVWSGDNPSSAIGVGLVREGRMAISLGTSDTVFAVVREPGDAGPGASHIFGSPAGGYMRLVCFRNGSLARERVRDAFGFTWQQFSDALRATPPGNHGAIMLPWFEPEITPKVDAAGPRRYNLDPADAAANIRGVVEGQMMAMALHAQRSSAPVDTIVATGGASANREMLQVMADVFDAEVRRTETSNSSCLGAALRAWHGDVVSEGREISWDEVTAGFTEAAERDIVRPVPENVRVYEDLKKVYARFVSFNVPQAADR